MRKTPSASIVFIKAGAVIFGLLTMLLVNGACRRQGVKYGGPPADYKSQTNNQTTTTDSTAQAENPDNKPQQ